MEQIGRIGWQRKRVLDATGNPIVPKRFDVFYSTLASPTYPTEANPSDVAWKADWTRLTRQTAGHRPPMNIPRARHGRGRACGTLMVVILEISNGGRALLNNIEFMRSQATDANARDEDSIGAVVETVLVNDFGLIPDQVTTMPRAHWY